MQKVNVQKYPKVTSKLLKCFVIVTTAKIFTAVPQYRYCECDTHTVYSFRSCRPTLSLHIYSGVARVWR